jgi:hypothetical protein
MSKIFTDEEGKRYEVDEQVSLLRDCLAIKPLQEDPRLLDDGEPSRHSK